MLDEKQDGSALSDLTVRVATASDEPGVTALWRASRMATRCLSKDFHFAGTREGSSILVGLNAQQAIVGSVIVGHDEHRGWIYRVACDPQHQRKGIGRLIVDAAERWLRNNGVSKVSILVRETNPQVVDFYMHLGFEAVPRVLMEKWLERQS